MFRQKMQYMIKSAPLEERQELEDLLNEMSDAGWDLYGMHEVEKKGGIYFDCIFSRPREDEERHEFDDVVKIKSFKNQMEKMFASTLSPYATCKELQVKIKEQKELIAKIKYQLDNDAFTLKEKELLNKQLSDEMNRLDFLKLSLIKEISPDNMYSSLSQDKFVINLSEELIETVIQDTEENLLAETVKIRQRLADTLGYVIPNIVFSNEDPLEANEFSIVLHGIEVFRASVFPEKVCIFKNELGGYKKKKSDIHTKDAITGKDIFWIDEEVARDFWVNKLTPVQYIGRALEFVSVKQVDEILDYNAVNKYMEIVQENNSFLINNIYPDYMSAAEIKYILSSLIRERVSVKDIVYLFEKINDFSSEESKDHLIEKIRLSLAKQILKDITKADEPLKVIELSSKTIEHFYEASLCAEDEGVVKMDGADVAKLVKKINKLAKDAGIDEIILLAPYEIRHMTFLIFAEFINNIRVLAFEELGQDIEIETIGEV